MGEISKEWLTLLNHLSKTAKETRKAQHSGPPYSKYAYKATSNYGNNETKMSTTDTTRKNKPNLQEQNTNQISEYSTHL